MMNHILDAPKQLIIDKIQKLVLAYGQINILEVEEAICDFYERIINKSHDQLHMRNPFSKWMLIC